ncbi:MAG: hypothetical protein M3Z05_15915 [Gemmatimonadota bacterium]|nr:hypothetical protein [Gemmatimonadota bacterium]
MKTRTIVAALALLLASVNAHAQAGAGARAAMRASRRAEQQQQKQQQRRQQPQKEEGIQQSAPEQLKRQQLQQQIRRSLWRVAKQRIGFTDGQMLQLERSSQRFDQERRQLAVEERAQRVAMRREILADSAANQATIATALDGLHALQQRRLDIQAEEQKEFSGFMTPLQRARFGALQEQVRKRLQEFDRTQGQPAGEAPLGTP